MRLGNTQLVTVIVNRIILYSNDRFFEFEQAAHQSAGI